MDIIFEKLVKIFVFKFFHPQGFIFLHFLVILGGEKKNLFQKQGRVKIILHSFWEYKYFECHSKMHKDNNFPKSIKQTKVFAKMCQMVYRHGQNQLYSAFCALDTIYIETFKSSLGSSLPYLYFALLHLILALKPMKL